MKLKKILSIVMAVVLCFSLASCSGLDAQVDQKLDVTQIKEEQKEEQKSEKILHPKVTVSDKSGNTLTVVTIYNKDGVSVIGGYIESAVDSSGKALNKKSFEYIGKVIALSKDEKENYTITYTKDSKFVVCDALFDEESNIVALQDAIDIDADKDKKEYFQVLSQVDEQGNLFIKLDTDEKGKLINVKIEKDKDGNEAVRDEDGKKVVVSHEGAQNSNPSNAEETTNSGSSNNTTNTTESGSSTTPQRENLITLSKNSTASTTAKSGVVISNALVTINKPNNYVINSDTKEWHGRIVVDLPNTASCEIRFEDVNISYNKGNILQIKDSSVQTNRDFLETEGEATDAMDDAIKEIADTEEAPYVDLVFPTGTSSTFHSTANSYTGVIYNESRLTIKGNGSLTVESRTNADNCLCSTKRVTIKNVTLDMTTAANTSTHKLASASGSAKGIFSYGKVTIESGKINIKTNGDAIRADDFYVKGGVTNLFSSACDGVDTDDRIHITGGNITSIALEKSAFKVRRVNNTINGVVDAKLKVRLDENGQMRDYFKITSGTVIGESKKMTEVTIADQANILARIKKSASTSSGDGAISDDDSQRRQIITITNSKDSVVKASQNKCTKFLYSSYALDEKESYIAKGDSTTTPANVNFSTKIGKAKIKCTV